MNTRWRQIVLIGMLLTGCSSTPPPPTFEEARGTAIVAGCWPGNGQTPLPVTVTPWGDFAVTPDSLLPTPTALPTTTAFPRCTPEPGAPTHQPYPTLAPARAPYPTRPPFRSAESQGAATMLHLPETVLAVDLAAHPSQNWPAVAAVAVPLTTRDDPRPFVRVFNPEAGRWSEAQSLGAGDSRMARTRFRTVQLGITGDGSVHAVWGVTATPRLGLYAAVSRDYGSTWVDTQAIARDTYGVLDVAATPDGKLAVLSISEATQQPIVVRREAEGVWQQPELVPVPAWYGSAGAIAILGEGDDVHLVVVTTGGGVSSADNSLFLLSRPFAGGTWQIERRSVPSPDERPADLLTHMRATQVGPDGLLVTFGMTGRQALYAVYGRERGQVWDATSQVVFGEGKLVPFAAPAYDAPSNRAVVFWTCCGDATFVAAESTHYTRIAVPESADWQPAGRGPGMPLISGAVAAADTASAQAPNSRIIWLAWVEDVHQVMVRSLDMEKIIPPEGEPTATPRFTPTSEVQP